MEKKVIIRTDSAGVHYGTLLSEKPTASHYEVTLTNARRIWQWAGANCLSELATIGSANKVECKFSVPVKSIKLMAIEVIEMTQEAIENLDSVKIWIQDGNEPKLTSLVKDGMVVAN